MVWINRTLRIAKAFKIRFGWGGRVGILLVGVRNLWFRVTEGGIRLVSSLGCRSGYFTVYDVQSEVRGSEVLVSQQSVLSDGLVFT